MSKRKLSRRERAAQTETAVRSVLADVATQKRAGVKLATARRELPGGGFVRLSIGEITLETGKP